MQVHEATTGGEQWEIVPSIELEENSRDKLHAFRASYARALQNPLDLIDDGLFDIDAHSDPYSPDKPVNQIIGNKINDHLRYAGNEFHTIEDFAWLEGAGLDRFDVLRSAKAETSAHGVFFGMLSGKESGSMLPIAIKPCVKKPEKSYMDWLNNVLVARTGRRHFIPVGFIYDEDRAYSITRIQRGVETLDNTDWRYTLMDPSSEQFAGQREQLGEVGSVLADLHEDRIFHGDPQFKNIASDPAGNTFFIDWEAAQIYGKDASNEILQKKAVHDLEVLFFSMAAPENSYGVGLLAPFSRSLQWEYFNEFVLTPYLEKRISADDSDASIEMLDAIEQQIKDFVLEEFTIDSIKKYALSIRA